MSLVPDLIIKMKEDGVGLMSEGQYMSVAYVIELLSPCNFLIFGLGGDARLWAEVNKGGKTVFLEDDKEWIKKFDGQGYEIYPVTYTTRVEEHREINFDSERLKMNLPEQITDTKWDVIFVDGPLGHNPPRSYKGPGRMQSIYTAHSLLKENGVCIIDDIGRLIEGTYARYFFKNTFNIIEDKVGIYKKGVVK